MATTSHQQPPPDRDDESSGDKKKTDSDSDKSQIYDCNICLDTAKDAVISMCGHLFCWPCLHQWLETCPNRQTCPVCKAAIDKDKVIPVYGRGGGAKSDPRDKVPPRPQGQRTEPENNSPRYSFMDDWFPDESLDDGGGDSTIYDETDSTEDSASLLEEASSEDLTSTQEFTDATNELSDCYDDSELSEEEDEESYSDEEDLEDEDDSVDVDDSTESNEEDYDSIGNNSDDDDSSDE